MKVIRCKDYDECSKVAADVFVEAIKANPEIILGLATGSSPIGIYKNLIKNYEEGNISFKNVRTYNLDEYVGISRENDQSYYYFMHDNLFNHVDIVEENVHVPYAYEGAYAESCKAYTE
jgi:glucosamine-6-phosphate deaminase